VPCTVARIPFRMIRRWFGLRSGRQVMSVEGTDLTTV